MSAQKRIASVLGSGRLPLVLLCVGGVAAIAAVAVEGPAANMIAEASGISLGSWLTLTLIKEHEARRDARRWNSVRDSTYRFVVAAIQDIAFACSVLSTRWLARVGGSVGFPAGMTSATASLDRNVESLELLVSEMGKVAAGERPSKDYPEIASVFERLRSITDRVISLGQEPDLVDHLLKVERAQAVWWELSADESDTAPMWSPAAECLTLTIDLYKYVRRQQDEMATG